jgi:hypothetical protein
VRSRDFKTGYLGQIQYANLLIRQMVPHLLHGKRKAIVVIQADEGPFPDRYRTSNRSWRLATPAELKMKTGIINAYYFPDGDYSSLADDITPINTFRMIFNKYFGTSFARLPDRMIGFTDYGHIYDFFDITDIVRGSGA